MQLEGCHPILGIEVNMGEVSCTDNPYTGLRVEGMKIQGDGMDDHQRVFFALAYTRVMRCPVIRTHAF